MGHKDKNAAKEQPVDDSDYASEQDEQSQVDIEQQVQLKIKQLSTLSEKVQAIAINGYLIQKRRLDQQMQKEQEEVQRKFTQLYLPHIQEINNIVQGSHAYGDGDFEDIGDLLTPQEQETKHNYFTKQKIPQYWLKVFMNSDVIGEHIEQRDEPLLKHLERLQAGKSQDLKRLWVDFHFSQNEWFTNSKLHKEFELQQDVIKKSKGEQIEWKEGKNITVKIVKKKSKKKGAQKKTKQVKQKSFFNFFQNIEILSDDQDQQEEQTNQQAEDLESQYEIAQALYQDVIPKSLQYYLGLVETIDDMEQLNDIEQQEDQDEPKRKIK